MNAPPQPSIVADAPHVVLASADVNVAALVAPLVGAVDVLGRVHLLVFGRPLIITSGNDGDHVKGSKHYTNRAVDLRSRDLTPEQQVVFGVVLAYVATERALKVFDERARVLGPHWHVETVV